MTSNTDIVREIVQALGGVKALATRYGMTEAAIFNWIMNGRFPSTKWMDLHDLAREQNFHLDPRDPSSFRRMSEDAA